METLTQVLERVVEENQWDEDPDGVIADIRAKCEGIALGDPRIWEVLIPEAEPADQLLFQKEEMGDSRERIALRKLEVVQRMSGILTSKVSTGSYKRIDGLRWKHRVAPIEDPMQYRCVLRIFGIPEFVWGVQRKACRALEGKGNSIVQAIEHKREMDGTAQDWQQFYSWLMEGKDTGSRIRAARSADEFLALTEEFAGEQYQQVAALIAEPEVRAELQQRLDALDHPEELQWPWEGLAKAWGVKEEGESEVAEKRRAVAVVVMGIVKKRDGFCTGNKWNERVKWCESREDYLCLLRVLGIPESDWGVKSRICRGKGLDGLVRAIEHKRDMDGTAQGWKQFHTWLMEGQDPGSRIRAARSAKDFLTLTEEFADEQYQQITEIIAEPEVRAELQQRLDALEHPEELQWPWEALAKVWGAKEEDELEVAEKRRTVAAVVMGMVEMRDGATSNDKWDERLEWCEQQKDYCCLLGVFGIQKSDWGIRDRMYKAIGGRGVGLVYTIERKRNLDGSARDWRKFYVWLMGRLPEQGFQSVPEVREYAGKEVARVLETGEMQEQLERRREQGEPDLNVERLLAQLQENPMNVFNHEYMVKGNGSDELTFGNPVFDEAMVYLADKS